MADARAVASYFVELAHERGAGPFTPMQLLKLTYIAHGYSLGLQSTPLIENKVEAWKFGPVIPDLYHSIKEYRDGPVLEIKRFSSGELSPEQKVLVEAVFDGYGDLSGIALSNLTHKSGTPWAKVYKPNLLGLVISNDVIEAHYKDLAA